MKIPASGDKIETTGLEWKPNPFDEYALEAALRLTEDGKAPKTRAGEVVVVTFGPKETEQTLRAAASTGADRAGAAASRGCAARAAGSRGCSTCTRPARTNGRAARAAASCGCAARAAATRPGRRTSGAVRRRAGVGIADAAIAPAALVTAAVVQAIEDAPVVAAAAARLAVLRGLVSHRAPQAVAPVVHLDLVDADDRELLVELRRTAGAIVARAFARRRA
ncbi:hypothetical protein [Sorangium cellulosum]|uniref:hypothetical protein n=1 Tax=Sorangium cellulosum TaxID=56 RepID=UPI001F3C49AC|nr:hypothetical protein [Sorangium cellulosum]